MSAVTKEWFSSTELAGIVDLPRTPQGLRDAAKREGWQSRKKAKGKGLEYHISSLPQAAQRSLIIKAHKADMPAAVPKPVEDATGYDRDALWDHYESKPAKQKAKAEYRLTLLDQFVSLLDAGFKQDDALKAVAKEHDARWQTIRGWYHGTNGGKGVKAYDRADWLAALVPGYVGRTAEADFTPAAWEFLKACYLRPEAPNISTCHLWTLQAAQEHGWTVPPLGTVQRWIKRKIPESVRVLHRDGENALMRLYPSQQRTVRDMHALQWINGDGYQHNVFVRWPDGSVARPKTWFWQDVTTRRLLGFRTDQSEHSDMIRLALGDVIDRYGIPQDATIDNTRAAANKWLTGGVPNRYRFKVKEDDPMGIFPQLGVRVHWTSVHNGRGHGQAKPVERVFGVGGLGEIVDKHPRLAGAYTGPNVMEKPDNYNSDNAVDLDVFLHVLGQTVAAFNAKPARRTELAGGTLSFDQVWQEQYAKAADKIRRPTAAQRRLWLLPAESIRVQRDSSIALQVGAGHHGRNRYSSNALINHIGEKLVVRFDPQQLHEPVHCYTLDGRYIGSADCIEAAGFGDSEAGREWAKNLKRRLKADKAAADATKTMSTLEAADWLGDAGAPEDPEPLPDQKVVRGAFEQPRRAVGSDVQPDSDDSGASRFNFDDFIEKQHARWKKDQL